MKEDTNNLNDSTYENGYLKEYFGNFKNSLNPESVKEFGTIKSDEERVKFIANLLPACTSFETEINFGKDETIAEQLKKRGNEEFIHGNTVKALHIYSEAILKIPFEEDTRGIAVAIANRSAALYHLERYEDVLRDVDMVLSFAYPKEMRYKVLERKAKSLLAVKKHNEAVDAFQKTLQALDDSKLSSEKRLKMQKDIQIMLNVMSTPKTKQGHVNVFVPGQKQKETNDCQLTSSFKRNTKYPAVSEKVSILEGEIVGRYATASKPIEPGETVAVEPAYCSVLLAEHSTTHCSYCFIRTDTPYPCVGCSVTVFCSKWCLTAANKTYHRFECPIASTLYKSGASVMINMALRIITQKDLQYFLDLMPALKQPKISLNKYKSDDYLAVYNLVRHENLRQNDDFLERSAMAVFLLRCLQRTGYFGDKNIKPSGNDLTSEEVFIGGLILRHLQLLQFNAHEIAELETDILESIDKSTSIFLGGGLFPTLALFNHSCDPAVVRYFVGKTVVVRTVRALQEGEPVAENYGPIFTNKGRADRQRSLRGQYWFDCGCQACLEDWPLLKNMNRNIIRFRCQPGGDVRCNGIIEIQHDTEEFLPKCSVCGKHTNILKGLKALQDTDVMFRQAATDTDRGKFQAALDIYLEILRVLAQHLAPPFHDFHVCQQAVRKCMLSLGSKYAKEDPY